MPSLYTHNGLLLKAGTSLAISEACCCVSGCPCCTGEVLGVNITLSGSQSSGPNLGVPECPDGMGGYDGKCPELNDSYFVPVDTPGSCGGQETFLLDICPEGGIGAQIAWSIQCETSSVTLSVVVILFYSGIFEQADYEKTAADCESVEGNIPLISANPPDPLNSKCSPSLWTINADIIFAA